MMGHEAEALKERTTMVLGCESFAEVVGKDETRIEETQTAFFGT